MTIEDKIGILWELSPEERLEVERYVEQHAEEQPHLRLALEEARTWEGFLGDARALEANPPGDDALAFYAVMHSVDAGRMPERLREAFRRIEQHVDSNPALKKRLAEMRDRTASLERASDANAHLERLLSTSGRGIPGLTPGERPPKRAWGRVAVGFLAAAAVYGILLLTGRIMQSESARIARFDRSELRLEGYDATRGEVEAENTSPATAAYIRALNELRSAQTGVLGLFPGFDQQRLDSAATYLHRVLELEPHDSFLASEAFYLLGKTELARGNTAAARDALQRVGNSRRSAQADSLLTHLPPKN